MNFLVGCLLSLCLAASASAATGIKGRVAWRGELVPGLQVRAYKQVVDIAARQPVAISGPTALDGTYQIDLPPGQYVLTARSWEQRPEPGDYFCYYSGSPVTVVAGHQTNVGFNLVKIPTEAPPQKSKRSGITGEISYRDNLLERVYLYVYRDTESGFKGPAYNILPVEKGHFRLRLPPGDYYLLARKRLKGGRFGPIEIGDYFNYYYGNPVRISAGEIRSIKLETITRLSNLEQGEDLPFRGARGQLFRSDGKPAVGLYVFAYRSPEMTGTPAFFSAAADAEGRFELALPEDGRFYLLARQSFGGPAAEGELYGKLAQSADHGLQIDSEHPLQEVSIHVHPTPGH